MDNDIPAWKIKTSVVATDNLKGGTLAGKFLATKLKAGDTLGILEGVPGVPALDARVTGMLLGLGALKSKTGQEGAEERRHGHRVRHEGERRQVRLETADADVITLLVTREREPRAATRGLPSLQETTAMTVDTHQHFWNLEREAQPWLTEEHAVIRRTFEPGDLEPLLERVGVERTVLVQAACSDLDTDSMFEHASRHPWIGAVIAWVELLFAGTSSCSDSTISGRSRS